MAVIFTRTPLDRMELTQGFGREFTRPDGKPFYQSLGLKGHNGIDLACWSGTPVYAVADGWCEYESSNGYGNAAWLHVQTSADAQLQIVHGHLKEPGKTGSVKRGDVIAFSDNTGMSTGPHLHWGLRLRVRDGSGWSVLNYDNGYFGYMDPTAFLPKDTFAIPVDRQYGNNEYTPGVPSWLKFQETNWWFRKTQGRLMTTREMKAFRFGFWDLHTVLNKDKQTLWQTYTKPEAQKLGLIPK